MTASTCVYPARDLPRPICRFCRYPFSDWFVWGNSDIRHCFVCWMRSGYTRTVLETGERIATDGATP